MHTTINHAKTQKGRDALIAFSYEAASEWKPQVTNKNTPRLMAMMHCYTNDLRHPYRMPYHNIIPCYVISNKFPRLLAEREIIANA